ncbi:hypothetical protein [Enterococcus italicus]|uniref:hypothetical protein n=1 Tax=Enterococcus italicus TaxID=246144 RepID=UPI0028AA1F23|nr:hypothetical protein [Enterococcus italicus]
MKKMFVFLGIVLMGSIILVGCSTDNSQTSNTTETNDTGKNDSLSFLSDSQQSILDDFSNEYETILKDIADGKDVTVKKLVDTYNASGNPDEGKSDVISIEEALTSDSNNFSATSLSKKENKTEANKRAFLDTIESYLEKKIDSFNLSDSEKQTAFYQTISKVNYPETFKKAYKSLDRLRPDNN